MDLAWSSVNKQIQIQIKSKASYYTMPRTISGKKNRFKSYRCSDSYYGEEKEVERATSIEEIVRWFFTE